MDTATAWALSNSDGVGVKPKGGHVFDIYLGPQKVVYFIEHMRGNLFD